MMYILITKNHDGSYTFSGYLKRTYSGCTLAECKKLYKQESKETGWNSGLYFKKGWK